GRELVVVGRQPRELVDREALAHVPVAVSIARSIPVRRRRCPYLKKYFAGANLGSPGAVNVVDGLRVSSENRREDENGSQAVADTRHAALRIVAFDVCKRTKVERRPGRW